MVGPDQLGEPVADRYRRPGSRADLAVAREVWAEVNARHTDDQATERWSSREVRWGLFQIPESTLGALGSVRGLDVLELGCGTAYLSAALVALGARPVGLDLSPHQLASARRCQREFDVPFPLVEAEAGSVPLRARSVDLVVSEYGAAPWSDPERWLAEAARVLRSGGRLVFLTNSVLAGLCVPPEGGFAGDRLLRTQSDLAHIEFEGGGAEHHPSHGDWIDLLGGAGFEVVALRELYAPRGAPSPAYYEIVTAEWARRWPAEDLWIARRAG